MSTHFVGGCWDGQTHDVTGMYKSDARVLPVYQWEQNPAGNCASVTAHYYEQRGDDTRECVRSESLSV